MTYNAVIITGPGFQDHDVVYTYYRLLEEGWNVDVATKDGAPVQGKYGVPLPMDKTAKPLVSFDWLDVANYDAVILTGGHEAPDRVRQDRRVLDFVAGMERAGKVVAGLCHGPWIMISAGVLKGRQACAYIGLRDDVINAGATVHETDVVVDGNIITCSYYGYVGRFMQAVFDTVASRAGAVSSPAERESAERESAEPVHPAEQTRAAAEPVLA
jgi:protease I